MTELQWLWLALAGLVSTAVGLFRRFYMGSKDNETTLEITSTDPKTPEVLPDTITSTNTPPSPVQSLWDTPEHAKHSVRVICDEVGLTFYEKNLICAVIMGESGFNNAVINRNKNSKGVVTSSDWGLVQCNDHWWIGEGKKFPSVEYVINNPEVMVRWMIECYRAGHLNYWCAYSNNSYKAFL